MRPILALNCLLQIEQERSEEESSVGDALGLASRTMVMYGETFYEGCAKSSVTNRLPQFYPRYILKCFTSIDWCVE